MIRELRTQIEASQLSLGVAAQAGRTDEANLHRGRLEDLIEMATRHGIDVTAWVDRSLLADPADQG